jgi:hypothetical protein
VYTHSVLGEEFLLKDGGMFVARPHVPDQRLVQLGLGVVDLTPRWQGSWSLWLSSVEPAVGRRAWYW